MIYDRELRLLEESQQAELRHFRRKYRRISHTYSPARHIRKHPLVWLAGATTLGILFAPRPLARSTPSSAADESRNSVRNSGGHNDGHRDGPAQSATIWDGLMWLYHWFSGIPAKAPTQPATASGSHEASANHPHSPQGPERILDEALKMAGKKIGNSGLIAEISAMILEYFASSKPSAPRAATFSVGNAGTLVDVPLTGISHAQAAGS